MNSTITLGGVAYPIAPLKFKDLKRVLPLFLQVGIDTEEKIEAQGEIITIALAAADPTFSKARFDDLTPTWQEITAAVAAVASLSGLETRKAGVSGEANPSPGDTSTAG